MACAYAATLAPFPVAARAASSVLAALLTLRFFVIYHDQQHHAILPHSRLAAGLMRVFGIFALSPVSIWSSSHNHHHKHNSNLRSAHIGSFPVMTKRQFDLSSKRKRFEYLAIRHPATIALGYVTMFLYGMCLAPLLREPKEHFDCLIALVVHALISVALVHYFGWAALILCQTVPHLITFGIGSYLFYAQHNFPGVEFSSSSGWAYEKAALESSSYMKTSPLMGWFTANIGYHHIHHLNHRIPFYRLPEVLRSMPELQEPKTTSLSPFEVIRCLRLKVWDADAQEMVRL
ncbi:MAG TPA: fatty acid desaturase [Opitutaceae bacterium]|jgi:omega-6 fatty acid desaturase (delta-12 desaturase)